MKGSLYQNLYKAKHVKYSENFFDNNDLDSYDELRNFIYTNYQDVELMNYNKNLRDFQKLQRLKQKKTYSRVVNQS